jgi:hypothetical protein
VSSGDFGFETGIIFGSRKKAMRKYLFLAVFTLTSGLLFAQADRSSRTTMYMTYGRTGANLREFNNMLASKGLSPLRNGYSNLSFGYMYRFNDFVVGMELFQNHGPKSRFDNYEIDYNSTRFYLNVGFSFTEEGRFQLIHYMSIGSGFLNFQMMPVEEPGTFQALMDNPAQGFVLREGNLHKGSWYMTGFLTEIGFQMSYDLPIPGRQEAFELLARFGYSFSPFEDSWKMNGIRFNAAQSGPFLGIGAGITLPDQNFFYRDASLGAHLVYGMHFTRPDELNAILEENGFASFDGMPNNWGLKILGETKGFLYGVDFYNLGLWADANESKSQTLNSIRVYANAGLKFFEQKNLEMGGMAGLGYGNIRYTLTDDSKPDFPLLFEEPKHDGMLKNGGLMAKPEVYIAYGIPISINKSRVIVGLHGGYELPMARYRLGDLSMSKYMSNPYLQFSLGFRP